jgi:hypothetical protein
LSRIGEVKPFEILDELVFPRYASHGAGAERSCWRIELPIGILKREIFDGAAMISWASISGLF